MGYGGSTYTTEIEKCYKSEAFFPHPTPQRDSY